MTTWTGVSTSSPSWTNLADVSTGYFEVEDGIHLLATESGDLLQQAGPTAIGVADWQDLPAVSTTTWTVQ